MQAAASSIHDPDQLPLALVEKLREALAETDQKAFFNVTHDKNGNSNLDSVGRPIKGKEPRGGPFGAALAISLPDGSLELVGEIRGNNVVNSGIGSEHAEDQVVRPDNLEKLARRLEQLKVAGEKPTVWAIASGQPCPNCQTKLEATSRELRARGLIPEDGFKAIYGATYDETLNIAGFNDAPYADAIILASLRPKHPGNRVTFDKIDLADTSAEVQRLFAEAARPTAAVVRNGAVFAVGREARTEFDLFSTPEVTALREASRNERKQGRFASWEFEGELLTTTFDKGPLILAESYWTKMKKITTVVMPFELQSKQFQTFETTALTNTGFLNVIAGGYQHPAASVEMFRDESFKNTAQTMWRRIKELDGQFQYNGGQVSEDVLEMRDRRTRFLFAAQDICNRCPELPHRQIRPLDPLGTRRAYVVD